MTRTTLLLGVLVAVLVGALWWLFLYSPGQEDLARLDDEIAAAEAETISLEQRVAQLEAVRARSPEIEAGISNLRAVVPDDPALPALLRQLQAAADDAGVELTTLSTARPSVADEALGLYRIQVSVVFTGSYFQTVDFLRRVEDPEITARGLTFSSLTASVEQYPSLSVSMAGSAFAVLDPVPDPAAEGATPTAEPTAEPTEGDGVQEDAA